MVGGTIWPALEIQPLNYLEHATQNIAEATALLELDSTKRAKLPAPSLDAFFNNVINLAKENRRATIWTRDPGKAKQPTADRRRCHPQQERSQQCTRSSDNTDAHR
jgi:hypothetical protein